MATSSRRVLNIELPPGSLVIADLHLDVDGWPNAPAVEDFLGFLKVIEGAPALVILGDLFEYWLGPSHAATPGGRAVLEALGSFGGAVYLVPGNRDVLAGSELEAVGVRVALGGLFAGNVDGGGLLMLHGDELCSGDPKYLLLRSFLRFGPVRGFLRHLPAPIARALARGMRKRSKRLGSTTEPLMVQQTSEAALEHMQAQGASVLLVGHAHAFRDEQVAGALPRRLCVLDAFDRLASGGAAGPGRARRDLLRMGAQGELEFISSAALGSNPR